MNKFMFFVPMTMATLFFACSSSPSDEPETPPLSKQIPIIMSVAFILLLPSGNPIPNFTGKTKPQLLISMHITLIVQK